MEIICFIRGIKDPMMALLSISGLWTFKFTFTRLPKAWSTPLLHPDIERSLLSLSSSRETKLIEMENEMPQVSTAHHTGHWFACSTRFFSILLFLSFMLAYVGACQRGYTRLCYHQVPNLKREAKDVSYYIFKIFSILRLSVVLCAM